MEKVWAGWWEKTWGKPCLRRAPDVVFFCSPFAPRLSLQGYFHHGKQPGGSRDPHAANHLEEPHQVRRRAACREPRRASCTGFSPQKTINFSTPFSHLMVPFTKAGGPRVTLLLYITYPATRRRCCTVFFCRALRRAPQPALVNGRQGLTTVYQYRSCRVLYQRTVHF